MNRKKLRFQEKNPIEIVEEAFHLLRLSPVSNIGCYYIGSLPFMLGALYFWADMSKSAYAYKHCSEGAFIVAILFIWMKCWQSVFTYRLKMQISGTEQVPLTIKHIMHLITTQTIIQPSGMFIIPAAAIFAFPFCWVYAFYQNVSVYGFDDTKKIIKSSWEQATLWPKQNHILIWILCPFLFLFVGFLVIVFIPIIEALSIQLSQYLAYIWGLIFALLIMILSPLSLIIAVNLGITIAIIPELIRILFGTETVFTLSNIHIVNTTFFACIYGGTYLCLDPVMKTCYVLRCFYGESVKTGADLKVKLREFSSERKKILITTILLLIIFLPQISLADENKSVHTSEAALKYVSSEQLDQSINDVMKKNKYTWRIPREKPSKQDNEKNGFLESFVRNTMKTIKKWMKATARWIVKLIDWLIKKLSPEIKPVSHKPGINWIKSVQLLTYILLVIIVSILVIMIVRIWMQRQRSLKEIKSEPIYGMPDLEDEETQADELPVDGWLEMAGELFEKGDLRLGLRAYFLAILAFLARQELISIAKYKSNLDYKKELQFHEHELPDLMKMFSQNLNIFERIWYGMHEITTDIVEQFRNNYKGIITGVSK